MNRWNQTTERLVRFGTFCIARICFLLFHLFRLFCLFCLFDINGFFAPVLGQTQTPTQTPTQKPHPAVVRIHARNLLHQESSLGSGTLIAEKTNYGFILTNWHVVRDSNGYVTVKFPDGKAYEAAVVAIDDRWDLALVILSEPQGVDPVVISPTIPKIGETYWVAGYRGDGTYRIHGGRFIQFQSPEKYRVEPEFIEIGVPSESGDSGGPIFNAKLELAGVLFGSKETTMGTHCGRLFKFLEQAAPNVASLPATPEPVIKAASLSRQSLEQRGEIAFGSSTTRATTPLAAQNQNAYSSSVSSSMSFGGSGIRARGGIQETPSQTFTRRKLHGFLNIEYDLSVAKTLLATEQRTGTHAQINTPVTDNFSLPGSPTQSSPAETTSGNTVRHVPPINRTGIPSGNTASVVMTDPVTGRNTPVPMTPVSTTPTSVTPGFGNLSSSSYPQSFGNNATSAAEETIPVSSSQTPWFPTTPPQTAGTSPANDGHANHGNTNPGGMFNDRSGSPASGTAPKPASGTFDALTRRETETTQGGTPSGTGNTTTKNPSNGTSNGAATGGRTVPASTGFGTYGQTPQPSSSNPTRNNSQWPNEDWTSHYALDSADMQRDEEYAPKYADDFAAGSPGADVTGATSKYDAIKIVIAILVIFFILFHTIKTMAVAEERQKS